GPGDEVIVQSNTYIATVLAVTRNGAVPVFTEPDDNFAMDPERIEKKLSPRTKAVLVTHLYGMMTPMDGIREVCDRHGLPLAEDCAQAHGCAWRGKKAGLFGDAGCFSFYPTKNLGAFGDGGAVVTPDPATAERIRIYRNYGSDKLYHNIEAGVNSRLDELQAGLLRVRLSHLEAYNRTKRAIAERYLNEIRNPHLRLPKQISGAENIWHQFVIRCDRRDQLQAFLRKNDIETAIHYPIPPHLSEAYRHLGFTKGAFPAAEKLADTVLSIPSYFGLTEEEQTRVINALNAFHPQE
ncbi:MAG: DegT/DnrJ/EryC1/StrS family aminotransferase, partial [Clostridia bacterium]|nr:DegT/DnrJ/EryC1/StrS family aminotransferase [Clostridia bacterium]